jgi:hypothetical protein
MGQFYYRNLYDEFFNRYPKNATKFMGISGFVGPDPVEKLHGLPFESQLIYGLQKENPNSILHDQLKKSTRSKVSVHYPTTASHSKSYIWLENEIPIRGLIGSANFSTNGLSNDFRETLIEVEKPDLYAVLAYINLILQSSTICTSFQLTQRTLLTPTATNTSCEMVLFDPRTGEIQPGSGLNWGFSAKGNVTANDASIPIRTKHIRSFPNLFQPAFYKPQLGHRSRKQNETIELIWDDGVVMKALFEGTQPVGGVDYPKQLCSLPNKSLMGEYLRGRLGLPLVTNKRDLSQKVTRAHLEQYGRNFITLSLIQPGIYSADFSVTSIPHLLKKSRIT